MTYNNGGTESLKHAAEFGKEIYKQAEQTRKEAVKQLVDMAGVIRRKARGVEGEAKDNADRIARNLEQKADYLNGRAVDQIEGTTEVMRQNVWKTTLLVFVFGVIIGLLLSRD